MIFDGYLAMQASFSDLEYAAKKKVTRRDRLLGEIEAITPWLMGDAVQGGRWHGRWDGLSHDKLNEGRDLPVHHDFRSVFAQALSRSLGVPQEKIAEVFPGYRWDSSLDGVFKA